MLSKLLIMESVPVSVLEQQQQKIAYILRPIYI